MIKIDIEENAAFDMLSILDVKLIKCTDKEKYNKISIQHKNLYDCISSSISKKKMIEITLSKEYYNLFKINFKLFELVDKAKKNEVTAKDVDDEVYNRHLAKQALQKKFFNNEIEEVKIGYV